MTSAATKTLTFAEWRTFPVTQRRHEIVDGVLITQLAPTRYHQVVLREIAFKLTGFIEDEIKAGMVFFGPLDFLIQREPLNVRQPDIMYMNSERTGLRTSADLAGMEYAVIPPDLVVEVLLPDEIDWVVESRIRDYHKAGVYVCWLARLASKSIEILDLTGEVPKSAALFNGDDALISDLLPGFTMPLRGVFREIFRGSGRTV